MDVSTEVIPVGTVALFAPLLPLFTGAVAMNRRTSLVAVVVTALAVAIEVVEVWNAEPTESNADAPEMATIPTDAEYQLFAPVKSYVAGSDAPATFVQ